MLPPRAGGEGAISWLYNSLRASILEGRLPPGARLPATRDLARHYGVARGTVVTAFEQLGAEGYLEGRAGSGTYVAPVLPDELLHAGRTTPATRAGKEARVTLSGYGVRTRPFPPFAAAPARAFRTDRPALDLFPVELWAKVAARRMRRLTPAQLLGSPAAGYEPLRRAIAGYLATSRGVRCQPEQVVIVSGVQEALDLVARVFLEPGARVAMEDPGYIGARLVFEAAGASLRPVPVDDEGLRLEEDALAGASVVYVTPAHQFPTGAGMSLARRLGLLEWAQRHGALIFEDDYDSEYRYAGRPMPALQGLDQCDRVLFAGSFSKVLFPSLRLGYVVLPPALVDPVTAVLSITSRHGPLLDQLVLTDFIADGHFGRHIRRMREIYAERLSVLLEEVHCRLAGRLEIRGVEAGLQTAAWLARGLSGDTVTAAAARRGVDLTPLSRYSVGPLRPDGLHLGFAAVAPPEIRRGVQVLGEVLDGMGEQAGR